MTAWMPCAALRLPNQPQVHIHVLPHVASRYSVIYLQYFFHSICCILNPVIVKLTSFQTTAKYLFISCCSSNTLPRNKKSCLGGQLSWYSLFYFLFSCFLYAFLFLFTQYITQIVKTQTQRPHAHIKTHKSKGFSSYFHTHIIILYISLFHVYLDSW